MLNGDAKIEADNIKLNISFDKKKKKGCTRKIINLHLLGIIQKRPNLHFHLTKRAKLAVCVLCPFAYVF